MTINNDQNNSTNHFAKAEKVGKFVILIITVFVGLACILLYFHLEYTLIALLAVLTMAISVFLFRKQTLFKIYSLPAVIVSLLLGASCIIMAYGGYSDSMSAHTKLSLKMAGVGLFMTGVGFAAIAATLATRDMNQLDFLKSKYAIEFKYPKYQMIMVIISGSFMILSGVFMTVIGLYVVANSP